MNELTSDTMSRFLPPLSRLHSDKFKPYAVYNARLYALSVYTETCSITERPMTKDCGTDIFLRNHPPKDGSVFCGFRLWINPLILLENQYKQRYGKCFPVFRRIYNSARLKIEARDIVSLVVRECPDIPDSWGEWKPYIDYTLNTYSLRVHIPLRFPV